ncbi:MAG TPA: serpin family protein [Anaerolineales bacterium]|nr:serpin family protein [Anaerolineales bacterium]
MPENRYLFSSEGNLKRLFFSLIVFAIVVTACGSDANIAKSKLRRERNPQVLDANLSTLVSGNNTFALDLYQSLRTKEKNFVISPYSISTAFAMTYAGARGETAAQIASTLHFDLPEDQLHSAFNTLDLALANHAQIKVPKDRDPIQLNIANAVWAQEDLPFQTPFLDTLGSNYGAGVHLADFVKNPDAARREVNDWAERETKGKIKDMVPEEAFDPRTRLVLLNAIYFEANWQTFFDSTEDMPFYPLDGSRIAVPTMSLYEGGFPYAEDENWFAIQLPYAGETFAMLVIVPRAGEFEEFEAGLDYQLLTRIISSLEGTGVNLTFPKFTFTNDFNLAKNLKTLGIADAFHGNADFSGITGSPDLYLDDALHKTYVAVDEEGTTAAAVTEIEFMMINDNMVEEIPVDINRPFIFVIRDVESGQILFIGRVLNPIK